MAVPQSREHRERKRGSATVLRRDWETLSGAYKIGRQIRANPSESDQFLPNSLPSWLTPPPRPPLCREPEEGLAQRHEGTKLVHCGGNFRCRSHLGFLGLIKVNQGDQTKFHVFLAEAARGGSRPVRVNHWKAETGDRRPESQNASERIQAIKPKIDWMGGGREKAQEAQNGGGNKCSMSWNSFRVCAVGCAW